MPRPPYTSKPYKAAAAVGVGAAFIGLHIVEDQTSDLFKHAVSYELEQRYPPPPESKYPGVKTIFPDADDGAAGQA